MLFETKVQPDFVAKVQSVATALKINPDWLMSCIGFETVYSFSPSIQNSIGATGLIQFMPSTAVGLGTTTDALAAMSAVEQLDYVQKYLQNVMDTTGSQIASLTDTYLAIFYPAAIGKPLTYSFSDSVVRENPSLFHVGNTKASVEASITAATATHSIGHGLPTVTYEVVDNLAPESDDKVVNIPFVGGVIACFVLVCWLCYLVV